MTGSREHHSFRSPPAGRGGFTLIELLVVMGIIVIIAAVSMPAFRFITGSRSVDSGQNVVNAMMGRARTQALTSLGTKYCGVFFFVDPRNDRTTLALVQRVAGGSSPYIGWAMADTGMGTGTGSFQYQDALQAASASELFPSFTTQLVQAPAVENYVVGSNQFPRMTVLTAQCIKTHTPTAGSELATSAKAPYSNQYWGSAPLLDIVPDTEFQLLPKGVGAAVLIDPLDPVQWNSTAYGVNRYVRTGCIMFDPQGRFVTTDYDIQASSTLGKSLLLNYPGSTAVSFGSGSGGKLQLFSGFGVTLFDREALQADAKVNGYTEGDYLYAATAPQAPYGLPAPGPAANEKLKQQWLDANGLLLTASRSNGSMTKSE